MYERKWRSEMPNPNDADIEMARMTEIANGLANAKKAGHCSHEKRSSLPSLPVREDGRVILGQSYRCDDCEKVGTWEELGEERREILIEWT